MDVEGQIAVAIDDERFHDMRITYSAGDIAYLARNDVHKAATSATTWFIWKYTYGADGIDRMEGPLIGSVDGQAGLSWG